MLGSERMRRMVWEGAWRIRMSLARKCWREICLMYFSPRMISRNLASGKNFRAWRGVRPMRGEEEVSSTWVWKR